MGTLTSRSIENAVIDDLETEVPNLPGLHPELRRRPTVAELLAFADKVAAMTPKVPQTDSVELLRESREER